MANRRKYTGRLSLSRLAVRAALLPVAATGLSVSAVAQDTTTRTIDEVVVTGSRIVRRDMDSVGPLTTITQDDIAAVAPLGIGQILQSLPAAGVSLNSNGTQGTSFGVSSANLRYLGSVEGSGNRTLVLVDGRRWINAVGGRGFRDFVDLNTIPMGIVDSVEVLKDGASAIYGADAISGVINIRTRRDVDGLEATFTGGQTSRSDGRNLGLQLVYGNQFERSSILLSANYVDVEPIFTTDRRLTTRTSVPLTSPPVSPRGLFALPGLTTGAQRLTRIPGAAGTAPGDFRLASLPDDDFNPLAQGLYLGGPSERIGLFGRVTSELTSSTTMYTEALFNRRQSSQLFSPFPLNITGAQGYTIPADHPFNPFDVDFAGGTNLRLQRWLDDVGNRSNNQDVKTLRVLTGFEGNVNVFSRDWLWDAFGSYSQNEATFISLNQVVFDRIALALGPNDRCVANNCVPLNIFGTITPEMADYIRQTARDEHRTTMINAGFNVTGSLVELPAGPLGVASGVEFRRETGLDRPDEGVNLPAQFVTTNRTSGAPRDGTSGSYNVKEAFLEFDIPLLADTPGFNRLDLSAAVRHSDYSTFGSETTSKLGLAWRPIEDVLLRGTWSEGFRAPSILELFQGGRETNFPAIDPCNGGGAGLPGCAGVPTTYNQANFGSGLIRGLTGGNPDLLAETAETVSVGLVLTPRFVEGLSFSIDWFKIDIEDAIAFRSAQAILSACANQGGANCNLVQRDPTTGEVLRLLQSVSNFAAVEVEGVDFTVRYGFTTPIGDFTTVFDASRLIHFINKVPQPDGSVVVEERAGLGDRARSTLPHWKGTGSLRWSQGPFEAGWRGRYIGSSTDVPNNPVNGGRHGSIIYHDLQFVYNLDQFDASVTLGIDNVTDRSPPASRANAPINFDIYTYDARGAHWYVRLFKSF
ncbi:MAG: TonB-dependent receptor [Gammaproteobacteria bacterium]|nr:MAG: TonB-dependent receptor [Gammaproteobacteria bacterium]